MNPIPNQNVLNWATDFGDLIKIKTKIELCHLILFYYPIFSFEQPILKVWYNLLLLNSSAARLSEKQ